MKISFVLFVISFVIKTVYTEHQSFLQFNQETLKHVDETTCRDPHFFIQKANVEESKPDNQDKIILYHGESYGSWLFQLILKEIRYPEAPEDWLPLRDKPLDKEIDKNDLFGYLKSILGDINPDFGELGLSVSPNLVSKDPFGESAWFFICGWSGHSWHQLKGLNLGAGKANLHSDMLDMIKNDYILKDFWTRFEQQLEIILKFIQVKRSLKQIHDASSLYADIQDSFPETFAHYKQHLESLPMTLNHYQSKDKDNSEGVALQIIMEKELADSLTYSARNFGFRMKKGLYSDIYKEEKNREDLTQARIALTNDFRSFPSRVRIKSIAGIMENHIDYDILKSMIKEMVKVNKKTK